LNSKKQRITRAFEADLRFENVEARFQNSLVKVIWMLLQKIEKYSEISPPDETKPKTKPKLLMLLLLRVPNSKNFVNFFEADLQFEK
jgi:hypothetical protein